MSDIIRVLRVIEYVGPRDRVEQTVANSIHGEKRIPSAGTELVIRAATIGEFPEILEKGNNAERQETSRETEDEQPIEKWNGD